MGIVFKPLPNPQNVAVCINSLPVCAAALSRSLKVGDVLRSVDDESTGGKSFVEVMGLIEKVEDSSSVRLLFSMPTANTAVEADVEKGEEETKEEEEEKITAIDDRNPDPTTTPPPSPTSPPRPGQIPDANRPVLLSLLLQILPPDRPRHRPRQ